MDYAANLALFLTERRGSPLAVWKGRLSAAEQRSLIGRVVGRGTFVIDGASERIEHWVSVCFGTDADTTLDRSWRNL